MRSREGLASGLPGKIIERVLSLLPVPALCRFRSVCKAWNELLCKPAFLDLCDASGGHDAYLFVTGHLADFDCCWVHDAYRRATCFLDLENNRWYSIPVDASLFAPTDENVSYPWPTGLCVSCPRCRLPTRNIHSSCSTP